MPAMLSRENIKNVVMGWANSWDDETDMQDRGTPPWDGGDRLPGPDGAWKLPAELPLLPAKAESGVVITKVGAGVEFAKEAAKVIRDEALTAEKDEPSVTSLLEQFTVKGEEDACWGWTGPLDQVDRPVVRSLSTGFFAQRIAYARAYKALPQGHTVTMKCGTSACLNPKHMILRTLGEGEDTWARVWTEKNVPADERAGAKASTANAPSSNVSMPNATPVQLPMPNANATTTEAASPTNGSAPNSKPVATKPFALGGPPLAAGNVGSNPPLAVAVWLDTLPVRGNFRSQTAFEDSRKLAVRPPTPPTPTTKNAAKGSLSMTPLTKDEVDQQLDRILGERQRVSSDWRATVYGGQRASDAPKSSAAGPTSSTPTPRLGYIGSTRDRVAVLTTATENIVVGRTFSVTYEIPEPGPGAGIITSHPIALRTRIDLLRLQAWLAEEANAKRFWAIDGQPIHKVGAFIPHIKGEPIRNALITEADGAANVQSMIWLKSQIANEALLPVLDRADLFIEEVTYRDESKPGQRPILPINQGAMYTDHRNNRTVHLFKGTMNKAQAKAIGLTTTEDQTSAWYVMEIAKHADPGAAGDVWRSHPFLSRNVARGVAVGRLFNQVDPSDKTTSPNAFIAKHAEIVSSTYRVFDHWQQVKMAQPKAEQPMKVVEISAETGS